MDLRKIAIRVLFASLAIAALAGVATLLAPSSGDMIARLIGTAVTTALAASLLLIAISALETTTRRPLGIVLGLLVCAMYTCTILAIWLDALTATIGRSIPNQMVQTDVLIGMCGIPLLLGAACLPHARLRMTGIVFNGIWCTLAFIWLFEIWVIGELFRGDFGYITIPLVIFSWIIALVLLRWPARIVWLGIGLATISCVLLQVIGFYTEGSFDGFHTLFAIVLCCGWGSSLVGVWNLLTYRDERYAIVWAEQCTIFIAGIALGALCSLIWIGVIRFNAPEYLNRIGAASGILATTAIVGIVIGQLLRVAMVVSKRETTMIATCPRCQQEWKIPQGKSKCPHCDLHIKVHIGSPGCSVCDYDLSGSVASNKCPECGATIFQHGSLE